MNEVIYAIGDIHGEKDMLRQLHLNIFDHHLALHGREQFILIHLGDYVDRGPDSCGVINYLLNLSAPNGAQIINLMGNHEAIMLAALKCDSDREFWMSNGGDETIRSYNDAGHNAVPQDHIDWLEALPDLYCHDAAKLIFVHAGIDVMYWPETHKAAHLWTRSASFFETNMWDNPSLDGWAVVHGHTPTADFYPDVLGSPPRRINLDTGACYGGRLTAAKFVKSEKVRFFYS